MARFPLTTNLPGDVREALDQYVRQSRLPINRIVEEGVVWRISGKGALPVDLEQELSAWCQDSGMQRSDVVELALRRFLEQEASDGRKAG